MHHLIYRSITEAPPHASCARRIPSRYGYRHVGISTRYDGSKGTNHYDELEDVLVGIKGHYIQEQESIQTAYLPGHIRTINSTKICPLGPPDLPTAV